MIVEYEFLPYVDICNLYRTLPDEVYPRQCPCRRAFDLETYWGPGELDGDQTKAKEHGIYLGSAPSKGKRPTSCLSDFVLMGWL
jgi:hypothetical protein